MTRRELRITVGRGFVLSAFALVIALFSKKTFSRATALTFVMRLFLGGAVAYAAYLSTSRTIPLVLLMIGLGYALLKIRLHVAWMMLGVVIMVAALSVPPIYLNFGSFFLGFNNAFLDAMLFEMLSDDFGTMEKIQSSFRSYEAVQAWELFETYSRWQQFFGAGFGASIKLGVSVSLGVSDASQEVISAVPITHIAAMTALVKCGWIGFFLFLSAPLTATYMGPARDNQMIAVINYGSNFVLAYVALTFQGYFSNLELLNVPVALAAITYLLLVQAKAKTTSRASA